MHALLSDRELSIHSHHPGLLVKLTERFCNQSVNMKLIHTPIRPMIEKRAASGVFIPSQRTHQISDQCDDKLPLPHTSCHIIN